MMKRGFLYAVVVIMLFSALGFAGTVFADSQETLTVNDKVLTYSEGGEFTLETSGGSGNGAVTFMLSGESAVVELKADNVTFKILDAGTFTVKAYKAAEGVYDAAESAEKTLTIDKGEQNALVITEVSPINIGDSLTLKTTGGSGDGAVTFVKVTGDDSVATVSGAGKVTAVGLGEITVKAVKAADGKYLETESAPVTVLVDKNAQQITYTGFEEKVFGAEPFKISAAGGVEGEFIFTFKSGAGYMTRNNTVVATGAGNLVINVFKTGDADFADVNTDKTIVIAKATQSDFAIAECRDNSDGTFSLITTGGTGTGALSFSITEGTATVSDTGILSGITGDVKVVAKKAGDNNYNETVSVEFAVSFKKLPQVGFGIVPVSTKKFGDDPFWLQTEGGSGAGAITYELLSGAATLTAEGEISVTGAGNIVVKAKKSGDGSYLDAEDIIVINVLKKEQATLTMSAVGDIKANSEAVLTASGGSGTGKIFFEVVSGNAVINADGKLIGASAGTAVVRAVRMGDENYEYAMSAEITVNILAADGTGGTGKNTGCNNGKSMMFVLALLPLLFVTLKKKI